MAKSLSYRASPSVNHSLLKGPTPEHHHPGPVHVVQERLFIHVHLKVVSVMGFRVLICLFASGKEEPGCTTLPQVSSASPIQIRTGSQTLLLVALQQRWDQDPP